MTHPSPSVGPGLPAAVRRRFAQQLEDLNGRSLQRRLRTVQPQGRRLEIDGRVYLNLAGNDYLGLANDPRLTAASIAATQQWGTGSGSSRLVVGDLPVHRKTEARFATWKAAEAALLFSTGYLANLAVLTGLPQAGDLICQDKLNHASLIDAGRLAGTIHPGLKHRVYPHGDLLKLDRLLEAHRNDHPEAGRWIVTDAVFSMDGDVAPLADLIELAERHEATLVLDEAHATGVLGPTGAGLAEHLGCSQAVGVSISTASKALGGLGGVVTAEQVVIDTLINRGRSFIYTTAASPGQAAAVAAGAAAARGAGDRRARLQKISADLRSRLGQRGWPGLTQPIPTPIVPLRVGSAEASLQLSQRMQHAGVLAVAIRPPTVPRGTARVRLSLRSDLTDHDIEQIVEAAGCPSENSDTN